MRFGNLSHSTTPFPICCTFAAILAICHRPYSQKRLMGCTACTISYAMPTTSCALRQKMNSRIGTRTKPITAVNGFSKKLWTSGANNWRSLKKSIAIPTNQINTIIPSS